MPEKKRQKLRKYRKNKSYSTFQERAISPLLKLIDLCHIMINVAYFWLKSKIYPKKVPVMSNNTLM